MINLISLAPIVQQMQLKSFKTKKLNAAHKKTYCGHKNRDRKCSCNTLPLTYGKTQGWIDSVGCWVGVVGIMSVYGHTCLVVVKQHSHEELNMGLQHVCLKNSMQRRPRTSTD